MSYSRGDILLVPIPFTDLAHRKVRPAVIIGLSEYPGDLFVVPISSQLRNTDLVLSHWREAGLNVPCGIKSQIATIEDALVLKRVGALTPADAAELQGRLKSWLGF